MRATETCSVELLRGVMDASPPALGLIRQVVDWDLAVRGSAQSRIGAVSAAKRPMGPVTVEDVERVVRAAMKGLERKLEELARSGGALGRESVVREDTAVRIFELMRRLEHDPKKKKAQLLAVFRITVLDGKTQREAASICDCKESLVSRRVAELEKRFKMSIEELRYHASRVLELESAAKGERSRKKKEGARPDADEPEEGEGDGFGGEEEEV